MSDPDAEPTSGVGEQEEVSDDVNQQVTDIEAEIHHGDSEEKEEEEEKEDDDGDEDVDESKPVENNNLDLVIQNEELEPDLEEYHPVISALPPRIIKQEENQVEVSASPAFQCLDEV